MGKNRAARLAEPGNMKRLGLKQPEAVKPAPAPKPTPQPQPKPVEHKP